MSELNGTVKFFEKGKGFGFVTPDDGSEDVHVSWASFSGCTVGEFLKLTDRDATEKDRKVSIAVEETDKGKRHAASVAVCA